MRLIGKSPLQGFVEICDRARIVGWARLEIGTPPTRLDILLGRQPVATVEASLFRADLKAAGVGDGHYGFSFSPPTEWGDFDPQDVSVRESTTGRKLRFLNRTSRLKWLVQPFIGTGQRPRRLLRHIAGLAKGSTPGSSPLEPVVTFIVPVYNTSPAYLDDLCASMQPQTSGAWELILSDDGSTNPKTKNWLDVHARAPLSAHIKILRNGVNRGIAAATNAGLALAETPWVGFIDHDDALAPGAVARILATLAEAPDAQFVYTDEVVADARMKPVDFMLKPDFDPVLLSGVNYINHLSLYRRDRLTGIGGLREGYEGSQDYDLLLRYLAGIDESRIIHLPYPAYLWRRDDASYSVKFLGRATDSARRALAEAYVGPKGPASVEEAVDPSLHRIRFDRGRKDWPMVSVIIPSLESLHLISRVLDGLSRTDYPHMEIIVVDNGSRNPEVLALYEAWRKGDMPFSAFIEERPFNFAAAINDGAAQARGDFILLLNNDIEILDEEWLKEMVSCFAYPDVGIVGAKLLYPNRTLQHAGVIVGLGGYAGHWHIQRPEDFPGPMGRLGVRQSLSAVTGACLLISRACLERTGPLDEQRFALAYNDIDLCLRARDAGFRVVYTPFATLLHHESASRGSDETIQNAARFAREKANLLERHGTGVFLDPALNPWYSRNRSDPEPVALPALPEARRGFGGILRRGEGTS
jgi:GT2 family glycosyltransferase